MQASNPDSNYNSDLSAKDATQANFSQGLNPAEPIVWGTSLISLPNEPKKEDKEPFWSDAAPEAGRRCGNGRLRGIGPIYIFFYFVMCLMIVLFAVVVPMFGSISDFIFGYAFSIWFILSCVLWMVAFVKSATFQYIKNISTSESAGEFLDSLCQAKPKITVTVICSHNETSTSTDSKGNCHSTTHNVVTFRQEYPIALATYEDATEPTDPKELTENKLTKIKVTQSFVADQNYEDMKAAWFEEHKGRDRKIVLVENIQDTRVSHGRSRLQADIAQQLCVYSIAQLGLSGLTLPHLAE